MPKYSLLLNQIFRTKDGKIVIWQFPNIPIIIWGLSLLLAKIVTEGPVHNLASAISFGALFTWAWLEIFQGVNYFRRALGLVILTIIILNTIK